MDRSALVSRLRETPAGHRIITALDTGSADQALELARAMGSGQRYVKVGLELFSAAGPAVVQGLRELDRQVFLDLKYHDIPNTVAKAATQGAALGAVMCTIHAQAGRGAMTAAAVALGAYGREQGTRPALLAVTILTSLSEDEIGEASPSPDSLPERIERLARLAWDCGCDGLVCSAADLPRLRGVIGPEPLVVTPGIRPAGSGLDDQHRVTTPRAAMAAGADFLVIGRPITQADDPAAALADLAAELETAGGTST
ncbi:orotidine-5'-phosphate decarboxylase [bacterium]|nr:MAG: orotidine-5'-phosphate decarboxylase [bacterium]